jgi:antitoxin component YwqK of YwqJK toxin-antitoxin module
MIKHVITNHPNFQIASFKEYVNNVLVKECHYDDKGELNGLFYENGSHHEKFHYINGKIVGLYQRWHPNGQLSEQITFNEKGEKEGLYQSWHDNGQLAVQCTFNKKGGLKGSYQRWYENGQLREQITFNEKGIREGLSQTWHDNGELREQITFNEKGEKEGSYQQWYDNGQLASVMQYSNGVLHGHYTSFKFDGSPLNSWFYENGKKI